MTITAEELPVDNPAANSISQGDINTTQAASTNFVDNAAVVDAQTRPVKDKLYGPTPYDSNAIADFLAKPVRIAGGELLTTDTTNLVKYTTSISNLLNAYQIWYRKIAGYNLIRATFNVKIVINANPFQQGRVVLNFIPGWRHLDSFEQGAFNLTLGQVTTSPNVELDIQSTSAEFSIPYISPYSYFDRTENVYDWGTIWLRVMEPLATGSGGATSCEYAIFGHWTDVELAGPIFGPEMSSQGPRKTVKKVLSRESTKSSAKGWVESAADKAYRLGGILEEFGVPGSSLFSAAADAVGAVANIFGWSKPLNLSMPMYTVNNPVRGLNVYDTANNAESFGLSIAPLVEPSTAVFGAAKDEMNFEYLKAIPAYTDRFVFSTSNVYGDLLYSKQIAPRDLLVSSTKTVGTATLQYRTGAPAFWMSHHFSKYRGGVKMTIKFVKTQYHSGRISISFLPIPSGSVTFDESVYVLREIVDLRVSSEITLVLPWIKPQNYLDPSRAMGVLQIRVLNELRAPETASQSIASLVYFSGADDFELACPTASSTRVFTPQMDNSAPTTLVHKGIGDSEVGKIDYHENILSVSDPFISLKQLFNCSRRIWSASANLTNQSGVIAPFGLGLSRFTVDTGQYTEPNSFILDYLQLFSHGFAFFRGGVRITRTFNAGTVGGIAGVYSIPGTTVADTLAGAGVSVGTSANLIGTRYNYNTLAVSTTRGLDANIPFWNTTPISYVRYSALGSTDYPALDYYPDMRLYFSLTNATTEVFRSGMDDYAVGYFRGFMPLAINLV